ncbi:hypothetical protein C7974DRAFT_400114 [Boeremia exigua]|uniref:uncharacterized protein n=1 Tax=Boeremia exigua TaxID=749465 RepID=UPI001E8EE6D5|nr:uncharacterized protein C7974DRAFT_400114 [Boeremia exigua]KAH6618451.1 hypothetical protein C7974DRAFT_400114 [Boeremia exigua]
MTHWVKWWLVLRLVPHHGATRDEIHESSQKLHLGLPCASMSSRPSYPAMCIRCSISYLFPRFGLCAMFQV